MENPTPPISTFPPVRYTDVFNTTGILLHGLATMPRTALLLLLLSGLATAADIDSARSLQDRTRNKVTGLNVQASWSASGEELVYSLRPPHADGARRWRVNLADGSRQAMEPETKPTTLAWQAPGTCRSGRSSTDDTEVRFENQTGNALELFWVTSGGRRESYGTLSPGETRSQHTYAGHAWLITYTNRQPIACLVAEASPGTAVITEDLCARPPKPAPGRVDRRSRDRRSPDGNWRVRFEDHNAILVPAGDGDGVALTRDGTEDNAYQGPARWSPDGAYVIFTQEQEAPTRQVSMIDSAPDDQLQPRVVTYGYRKPGDDIPRARPALVRLADHTRIQIPTDLFPTPWSLGGFHWAPDSSEVYVEYNQRGHQVYRVLAIDAATGGVRTVIEETSPTFIDYSNKIDGRHLDATNQILWMSERDGWNHLYIIDRATGNVRQLTRGHWVVRGVDSVDEDAGQVWFRVMGIDPDQDPYHVHYARIGLDGTGLVRLTEGNGTHQLAFSPDRRHYIDTWSRVDHPPVHELRRSADGARVCELGRANDKALHAAGWIAPEPFTAKGRDGATDIWGVIYRPSSLDMTASYPVIESIYAGPQDHHVPKPFAAYRATQALAELGFIVVQIDGMGTNWRSKAFHDVAWKNLKDAGFPDRVAWIRTAAERYPYLDLARVGIYGGSAGGQNAMRAVLDHPDFYRAAAADCGCHDNRMDKIWWNEAWMGWPVDQSYEDSSNVVDAHKLGGALLLTVGELDRNVDPASTMQVVDALIKADKNFELIVFPGQGHGAGNSPYGRQRLYDFFIRHLRP